MDMNTCLQMPSFDISIYERGATDAENVALVLPGFLDSKDYPHMHAHVDFLASKGYYAIAFDPPGTWESGGDIEQYTISAYMQAIVELIAYFGNRPTLLMGHSLGGMMAQLVAARNDYVVALVAIMSPASFVREQDGVVYGAGVPMSEWRKNGVRLSRRDLPTDPKARRSFAVPFSSFGQDAGQYNTLAGLKASTVPKLFIAGKHDTSITPTMVQQTYQAAAEPKVFALLDSDHNYRHHPDLIQEVNGMVGDFLDHFDLSA